MVVNRQHPILSPLAFLSAVLLMAGVGISVLWSGGAAFSPGQLSAAGSPGATLGGFGSHADIENACNQCHTPFRGVTVERCERCHVNEAKQRAAGTGLHSAMDMEDGCAKCHPEHEGPAFDLAAAGLLHFDHSQTGFELTHHIQDYAALVIDCQSCHAGADFDFAVADCVGCHAEADRPFMLGHLAAFGDKCLICHDGVDRMADFDHSATALPLEGAHEAAKCGDCHSPDRLPTGMPAACASCHAEPAVHAAVFGSDCAACHTAAAWSPARLAGQAFTHAKAGFTLERHTVNFRGQPLTCRDCHTRASSEPGSLTGETGTACADCHAATASDFMAEHVQTFGLQCVGCHDGTGNMAGFDHAQVFVLDGAHAPLECAACHADLRFQGTPAECAACHAEPEIHAGIFGLECAACHTAVAWTPAALRAHTFPLDHGDTGLIACATCHTATYTAYTCYGCHEHDPQDTAREHAEEGIGLAELPACAQCHPTGHED